MAELKSMAQGVVNAFNRGTGFDALIEKFSDNPGMTADPARTWGNAVTEVSVSGATDGSYVSMDKDV